MAMEGAKKVAAAAGEHEHEHEEQWGKAFEWEIKGAGVDAVWAVTSDFVGVDKWVTTLVQSCQLVEGQPNQPGCVRKAVLYPEAPGQPFTWALEKLLELDEHHHRYSYTILAGTLPGFSLMDAYVSTFQLSPLLHDNGTLLQWSFVCRPVSTLSEEQAQSISLSLYQVAINDLKARLSLADDSISFLTKTTS